MLATESPIAARPSARWRNLKRLGWVALAVLLITIVVRLAWGMIAWRRLDNQLDAYRRSGQPVDVWELNAQLDKVPPQRNKAVPLETALDEMVLVLDSGVSIEDFYSQPYGTMFTTHPAEARELFAKNAHTLQLVRKAKDLPDTAWSTRLASGTLGQSLSAKRNLVRLLHFAVAFQFRQGDHQGAISTLRDFMSFSDSIAAPHGFVNCLVSWTCYDMSLLLIEDYFVQLQVDDPTVSGSGSIVPARRSNVEHVITDLLQVDDMREFAIRERLGKRASVLHELQSLEYARVSGVAAWSTAPWKQVVNTALHPILVLDTLRSVRVYTDLAATFHEQTMPLALERFPHESTEPGLIGRLVRPCTSSWTLTLYSGERRYVELYYRSLARRRMAAIAVAVRLFEIDHQRQPEALAELIPDYLAELPLDPMTREGRAFGYKPQEEPPIMYCVGLDGVDHGGKRILKPDGRIDRHKSDLVFRLEPKPEQVTSDGQTGDDKNKKEDQRGNDQEPKQPENKQDKR